MGGAKSRTINYCIKWLLHPSWTNAWPQLSSSPVVLILPSFPHQTFLTIFEVQPIFCLLHEVLWTSVAIEDLSFLLPHGSPDPSTSFTLPGLLPVGHISYASQLDCNICKAQAISDLSYRQKGRQARVWMDHRLFL
jgi:hypothetical protein